MGRGCVLRVRCAVRMRGMQAQAQALHRTRHRAECTIRDAKARLRIRARWHVPGYGAQLVTRTPEQTAYAAYSGLECLNSATLCPMTGRCPRCTAVYHSGEARAAHAAGSRMAARLSEAELVARALLADMLNDADPDFDRCRRVRALQKIVEGGRS